MAGARPRPSCNGWARSSLPQAQRGGSEAEQAGLERGAETKSPLSATLERGLGERRRELLAWTIHEPRRENAR
jgi:hypothetical protein